MPEPVWLDLEEVEALPKCGTECEKRHDCPRRVACQWEEVAKPSRYSPLSREVLLLRGRCCGNGCLNCPYP
jgi:hypothetical protein